MDELAHVNLFREMEVWRRPTLTLSNAGLDEVSEWVRQLEFPRDDKRLGGWEHIQLPDYEPLVVKVLHSLKGAPRPFHIPFPTEFPYVLNS